MFNGLHCFVSSFFYYVGKEITAVRIINLVYIFLMYIIINDAEEAEKKVMSTKTAVLNRLIGENLE